MNETMQTILSRRSCRSYKKEQIREEDLQQILQEAFHSCGMTLPANQSFRKSLEMLQPMFPGEDMARELECWGENKTFRILPGLQISRAPKLCEASAVIRNAG